MFHVIHYTNPLKRTLVLLLEKLLGLFTDMIVCVSHSDRENVIKTKIARTDKVKTIWNGIDVQRLHNVSLDKNAKKSELRLLPGAFVLTMVGRRHPSKDSFTLIVAFQLLQHQLPDARLPIVGDGRLREELEQYAKNQQVDNKVVFTGVRRDVPEILAVTDIVVLSTLWEGLPYVLLEAMASAKPVIASDVGGNWEVVIDGETGILVPPKEPDSLARAIIRLARNAKKRREMGEKGLARVKDNFTVEEMTQNIENVYEAPI